MQWQTSPTGHFLAVSDEYCAFTGFARHELVGHQSSFMAHMEDLRPAIKSIASELLFHERYAVQLRIRHNRTDWAWVVAAADPVFAFNGSFEGWAGVCVPIEPEPVKAGCVGCPYANRYKDYCCGEAEVRSRVSA